jgi:hypothetical protein
MDDDADSAREYERLRAELAEFVLGVLTERLAAGDEPKLSQALIDAIDRRVEDAVAARLGSASLAEAERPSRPTRRPPPKESWFTKGRIAMLAVAGLALAAAAAFIVLRMLPAGPTNTTTISNFQTYAPDTPPDGMTNVQQPPQNGAAPTQPTAPPAQP